MVTETMAVGTQGRRWCFEKERRFGIVVKTAIDFQGNLDVAPRAARSSRRSGRSSRSATSRS